MFSKVLISVFVAATVLSAQGGGMAPPGTGPQTLFEQFGHRLDLDRRTQFPEAEKLFTDASRLAAPIAQQMQQLRVRLVNAEIDKNDAEIKIILPDTARRRRTWLTSRRKPLPRCMHCCGRIR